MINANELRIGNWVQSNKDCVSILDIMSNGVITSEGFELLNNINQVLLTPDVVKKCGFENSSFAYYLLGVFFIEPRNEEWVFGDRYQGAYTTIKSLHQLQNLYFALTGTELEYKP